MLIHQKDMIFILLKIKLWNGNIILSNENEEQQTNNSISINNIWLDTTSNTKSSSTNSLTRKFSKIHVFGELSEPRNATEGKFLFIVIFINLLKLLNLKFRIHFCIQL